MHVEWRIFSAHLFPPSFFFFLDEPPTPPAPEELPEPGTPAGGASATGISVSGYLRCVRACMAEVGVCARGAARVRRGGWAVGRRQRPRTPAAEGPAPPAKA